MAQKYRVTIGESEYQVTSKGSDGMSIEVDGTTFDLDVISDQKNNTFHLLVNDGSYNVVLLDYDPISKEMLLSLNGKTIRTQLKDQHDLLLESLGMHKKGQGQVNEIKAPMPGMVLDIVVKVGQEITASDPLIVLEAMKMENVIKAPNDGVIDTINVEKGFAVDKNEVLITLQ